jgi:20S proteasome subunit beta 2
MSVFESSWREDMEEQEAEALVKRAIGAGIFNDLGSGSNCDTCIIRLDGTVSYNRNTVKPNPVAPLRNAIQHSATLTIPKGTTAVLSSHFTPSATLADVSVTDVTVMETE